MEEKIEDKVEEQVEQDETAIPKWKADEIVADRNKFKAALQSVTAEVEGLRKFKLDSETVSKRVADKKREEAGEYKQLLAEKDELLASQAEASSEAIKQNNKKWETAFIPGQVQAILSAIPNICMDAVPDMVEAISGKVAMATDGALTVGEQALKDYAAEYVNGRAYCRMSGQQQAAKLPEGLVPPPGGQVKDPMQSRSAAEQMETQDPEGFKQTKQDHLKELQSGRRQTSMLKAKGFIKG